MTRLVLVLAVGLSFSSLLLFQLQPNESKPPELPKNAKINGDHWFILHTSHLEGGDDGQTNCASHTIQILTGLKPRDEAITLIHEIEHALGCESGNANDQRWNNSNDLDDGCEGHCGIYWSSPLLVDFIADNPELIRFIQYTRGQGK